MLSRGTLASIPVEIWHQFWELAQRAELKVLSRTCHFFRDICLPLLFANLTHKYTAHNAPHWSYWELSSVTMLRHSMNINRLAASSKLAALPRRWQVSDIGSFATVPAVFDDSYTLADVSRGLYLESISRGLSAFTGLRAIEFHGIRIGEDILGALNKLPSLKSLVCLSTSFSCCSVTPRLRVREFTLFSDSEGPIETSFGIVSSEFLERLTLKFPSFPKNLTSLSNQGHYRRLSDLSLLDGYLDTSTLLALLRLCPQLRNLNISATSHLTDAVDVDITPLPTSIIPHLQSFSGRGYLARIVIPGRPVEMVSIQRREWIDTQGIIMILKSISQSTLPIRGLHLPSMQTDSMVITFIRTHFPYLKFLRLSFQKSSDDMWPFIPPTFQPAESVWDEAGRTSAYKSYAELMGMLCLNNFSLPSGIQAVEILSGREGVTALQCRSYLTKLSDLYPSLRTAVLGNNQWIKHRNDHWESVGWHDSRLSPFKTSHYFSIFSLFDDRR